MTKYSKMLLAGVAAMSFSVASAYSQDNSSILNGIVDSVESTVDDVVGGVESTLDTGNIGDVGGVTGGDNSVGDVLGDVTGNGNSGDIGSGTDVADIGNFSDLLEVMDAGNTDLSNVGNISEIRVINVQEAFQDFDANLFNDALNNNAQDIANLQDTLSGNSVLNNALTGNNIEISDVVAMDANNDGQLIIYTDGSDD